MPRAKKIIKDESDNRLIKNFKLEFNKMYTSKKNSNKNFVIRKPFLDYEEIYLCSITIYNSTDWTYKFYPEEPFTIKEICEELNLDYKTVIKP